MDYDFLVFLYFCTIVGPALLMAAFYAHIYSVVLKQLRQMVTINGAGGSMLRVLGAARKRDVKATKNLSIIVLFFIICWFPLYTINFVQAYCQKCSVNPSVLNFFIILSHLNSAGNPLLYAYHLTDFRAALRTLLCETRGKDTALQPKRHPVYRIPNSTPKLPHKIFDLETPEQKADESRYRILKAENGSRSSLDSNIDLEVTYRTYGLAHSSPPTPTKPQVIIDPT
ncbi:unnamed protein product [Nezara viridula]|uniref:G-protein coupled receptors family 1 profile domain-containing protein n=1 Tax=Nezara viridula TaxID=85310 RepID=A0A9P0HHE8_NEZVI|nr:unnamed protein product [Nezara viridula]